MQQFRPLAEGTSDESRKRFVSCKGWTLDDLIKQGPLFRPVPRVSALNSDLVASALKGYESSGIPLIIEHLDQTPEWPKDMFNVDWLLKKYGHEDISTRNVHEYKDQSMNWTDFINQCRSKSAFAIPGETERFYGKDVDCPEEWRHWLQASGVIPTPVIHAGPNDLMRHMRKSEEVETQMCYLGIGDTFTPCHKDLCASSGHNLMCYTENDGSSFWFMTESSDAAQVAQYFRKKLGKELDWENHVLSLQELADIPSVVYITEQKLGDLVLVPPRSCHQVINHGGLTVKASWSRMTIQGLVAAFYHELPVYQRVCRPELYRIKYILYRSLLHWISRTDLKQKIPPFPSHASLELHSSPTASIKASNTGEDFAELECLVELFDDLLRQEFARNHASFCHILPYEPEDDEPLSSSLPNTPKSHRHSKSDHPSSSPVAKGKRRKKTRPIHSSCTLACDFCGADIFQSFFECQTCAVTETSHVQLNTMQPGDGVLICPSCYVEGRTCQCEKMIPVQCRPFEQLLEDRSKALALLNRAPLEDFLVTELNQKDQPSDRQSFVFEAACLLECTRRTTPEARKLRGQQCRPGGGPLGSHRVSYIVGLSCSRCHNGKCYKHLLQMGIHSSEAVLLWHADATRKRFHERHNKVNREVYELGVGDIERAGREGITPAVRFQLVAMAKKYPDCRPLNPKVRRGWYDTVESGIRIRIPAMVHSKLDQPRSYSPPMSPLTELDDSDSPTGEKDDESISNGPKESPSVFDSFTATPRDTPSNQTSPLSDVKSPVSSKPRQNRAYVLVPPMSRAKKRPIPLDVSDVDEAAREYDAKRKKLKRHRESRSELPVQPEYEIQDNLPSPSRKSNERHASVADAINWQAEHSSPHAPSTRAENRLITATPDPGRMYVIKSKRGTLPGIPYKDLPKHMMRVAEANKNETSRLSIAQPNEELSNELRKVHTRDTHLKVESLELEIKALKNTNAAQSLEISRLKEGLAACEEAIDELRRSRDELHLKLRRPEQLHSAAKKTSDTVQPPRKATTSLASLGRIPRKGNSASRAAADNNTISDRISSPEKARTARTPTVGRLKTPEWGRDLRTPYERTHELADYMSTSSSSNSHDPRFDFTAGRSAQYEGVPRSGRSIAGGMGEYLPGWARSTSGAPYTLESAAGDEKGFDDI